MFWNESTHDYVMRVGTYSCVLCLLIFLGILHIFIFPNNPQLVQEIERAGIQFSGIILVFVGILGLSALWKSDDGQSSPTLKDKNEI